MIPIGPRHIVVDLSSGDEVKGAAEVNLDTNEVLVCERDFLGAVSSRLVHLGGGIRIVRRR